MTSVAELKAEYESPWEAVAELTAELEERDERIDELEAELAEYRAENERDKAEIRLKVTDVEERVEEHEPDVDLDPDDDDPNDDDRTPLERIVALPEHMVERELTANQERARFIAKDVHDYAEKAPAGLVVNSRTVKKVIAAKEDKRPHTQTVGRVMDFLDELGTDGVELKKHRGNKIVVFDRECGARMKRANHSRCDGAREGNPART